MGNYTTSKKVKAYRIMGLFKTNHYHIGGSSREYVPYEKKVTINEHRAPTDDSIRILNEMEDKTRQNIVAEYKLGSNELLVVMFVFVKDCGDFRFIGKFKVNGHEIKIEKDVSYYEFNSKMMELKFNHSGTMEEFAKGFFYAELGQALIEEVIRQENKIFGLE